MSEERKNQHYIYNCVDRDRFRWKGSYYTWSHPLYKFEVKVEPSCAQTGTTEFVRVTITDLFTGRAIKDWSRDVICNEGDWRDRLQAHVGKLVIKAQHRPFCPECRLPLRVKQTANGSRQFFGCKNYKGPGQGCQYTRSLETAFDLETQTTSTARASSRKSVYQAHSSTAQSQNTPAQIRQ